MQKQNSTKGSLDALSFALGALVYPKEMLKELRMNGEIVAIGSTAGPGAFTSIESGRDLIESNEDSMSDSGSMVVASAGRDDPQHNNT